METMTTTTEPSDAVTPTVAAEVIAALSAGLRQEKVIEKFGLTVPQFQSIMRERNQALARLLDEWAADESGYEEDNAEAIERALQGYPLSLREASAK